MQIRPSYLKYIGFSIALHLGVLCFYTSQPTENKVDPVSVGFGFSKMEGGSAKMISKPAGDQKKISSRAAPAILKTDKPALTQPTATATTTAAETAVSSGTGAETSGGVGLGGNGTGKGYTSGAGGGLDDSMARYRGLIHQLLDEGKIYPQKAKLMGKEGIVKVEIKLSKDGKLLDYKIVKSSQYEILNDATKETLKKIKKYPKIPDELNMNEFVVTVPFKFSIKDF